MFPDIQVFAGFVALRCRVVCDRTFGGTGNVARSARANLSSCSLELSSGVGSHFGGAGNVAPVRHSVARHAERLGIRSS